MVERWTNNNKAFGSGWLQKYGYLPHTDPRMAVLRSTQTMQQAIAAMQGVYGLNVTGTLDERTTDWMKKPRCGNPDKLKGNSRSRKRRYALTGQKWQRTHITYSIKNVTPKVGSRETHDAIRRAFDVWQGVTPLHFEAVPYSALESGRRDVDITIIFASGFHGDSSPFDGEGGFLAHAYFPGPGIGGDTHFDSDEPWTLGNPNHDERKLPIHLASDGRSLRSYILVMMRLWQTRSKALLKSVVTREQMEPFLSWDLKSSLLVA
ncbi:unnamed protein product [Coregonus sp. 'balchen']|nr:unnamed protein product [Coregonus sp. 'balchen']